MAPPTSISNHTLGTATQLASAITAIFPHHHYTARAILLEHIFVHQAALLQFFWWFVQQPTCIQHCHNPAIVTKALQILSYFSPNPMRWIQLLLALNRWENQCIQNLYSLFTVTGRADGRTNVHLRLSDALDGSIINLPSVWFPNNSLVFFARRS